MEGAKHRGEEHAIAALRAALSRGERAVGLSCSLSGRSRPAGDEATGGMRACPSARRDLDVLSRLSRADAQRSVDRNPGRMPICWDVYWIWSWGGVGIVIGVAAANWIV
jgi:hypothetical protein